MRRLFGWPVLAAAAVATVAGCSFSVGTGDAVDMRDLAKEISAQYKNQVGRAPDSVECPNDLQGEVGATTRCTLTVEGETYGVDVNVTKVDGSDVRFDLKVDDKPQ
jgi:hypothetical protein